MQFPQQNVDLPDCQENWEFLSIFLSKTGWGAINADGTIAAGSGNFSSVRTGAGQYTITWNIPKPSTSYAVVVQVDNQAGVQSMGINWRNRAADSFGVTTFTWALVAADSQWCFVVMNG